MLRTYFTSSQTNNLTGSPYSIFGLGIDSYSNTGRNSGMGRIGIALESFDQINLLNPASFVTIDTKRFIFDIGMIAELESISGSDNEESRIAANFSNVSIGFNGNGKYGLGFTLKPKTNVGYIIAGVQENIEGSNENYISNLMGSGGLNELRIDYGKKLTKNVAFGVKASYLFGNIDETETAFTQGSSLSINQSNFYTGFLVGFGLQYKFSQRHIFGVIVDLPTNLRGVRNTIISQGAFNSQTIIEQIEDEKIKDFKQPLKFGVGFSTRFKKLLLSADYTTNLWSNTNQTDGVGKYTNQSIYTVGAEFVINYKSDKYFERIKLRAGANYNTGNLEIDNNSIKSFNASIGFGLPIGRRYGSILNVSYNIGNRGTTDSFLLQENINTLNINVTLTDIWFRKALID